jgi:hypothetical protein
MVNVPGRSKGCKTCRGRKIRVCYPKMAILKPRANMHSALSNDPHVDFVLNPVIPVQDIKETGSSSIQTPRQKPRKVASTPKTNNPSAMIPHSCNSNSLSRLGRTSIAPHPRAMTVCWTRIPLLLSSKPHFANKC